MIRRTINVKYLNVSAPSLRAVKEGQPPAKTVAPPPSAAFRMRECLLYGMWQTEPLRPPQLVDGRLPLNRYGNLELLYGLPAPEGTVHLKVFVSLDI